MFVSYVGIRVTDMERSLKFYQEVLGLQLVRMGDFSDRGGGRFALLRDAISGARIELNWYAEGSVYALPFQPGEGLDHIGVKVDNVAQTLSVLASRGIEIVPIPEELATRELSGTLTLHMGFAKDPDGNWICFYDHEGRALQFVPTAY